MGGARSPPASAHTTPWLYRERRRAAGTPVCPPLQLPELPTPPTPGSGIRRVLASTATPRPPTSPVLGGGVPSPRGSPPKPDTPQPGDGSPPGAPAGNRTHVPGSGGPGRRLGSARSQPGPGLPCPHSCVGCPSWLWGGGTLGSPRRNCIPPPPHPQFPPLPDLPRQISPARRVGAAPGGGPWCSLMWL